MKQGDKVKVRILTTGKVIDATYGKPCDYLQKSHVVWSGENCLIAIGHTLKLNGYAEHECRFIGNAGVRE